MVLYYDDTIGSLSLQTRKTWYSVRIFKIIATSGFLTALECIVFLYILSSAPDPDDGEAYSAPPDPPAGLRGATSKGKGRGRRKGRKRRGRKGEGPAPHTQIPGAASGNKQQLTNAKLSRMTKHRNYLLAQQTCMAATAPYGSYQKRC